MNNNSGSTGIIANGSVSVINNNAPAPMAYAMVGGLGVMDLLTRMMQRAIELGWATSNSVAQGRTAMTKLSAEATISSAEAQKSICLTEAGGALGGATSGAFSMTGSYKGFQAEKDGAAIPQQQVKLNQYAASKAVVPGDAGSPTLEGTKAAIRDYLTGRTQTAPPANAHSDQAIAEVHAELTKTAKLATKRGELYSAVGQTVGGSIQNTTTAAMKTAESNLKMKSAESDAKNTIFRAEADTYDQMHKLANQTVSQQLQSNIGLQQSAGQYKLAAMGK